MKIGQVVRQFGIPVNSLYFYINNGLLVPQKHNNQYIFDEKTLEDIRWIQELKELEFPLKTIHRLLSLRRISNLCAQEDREELRQIYRAHQETLRRREQDIARARQVLDRKLAALDRGGGQRPNTGVPVDMLHLLCCPRCGGELLLEEVSMSQKYVFRAHLRCPCGYQADIRNGILETGNVNTSLYDKPDPTRELYRDLPSMTLSLFERSYRWLEERIRADRQADPRGKVWLESYVTAWFFLHNHLDLLGPEDCLIVIDKFHETLLGYKDVIERQGAPFNILYIADAGPTPPIREHIIDRTMDFFGTNEHSFYHENFYLEQMLPYLKDDCRLFGVYFFFQGGTKSMKKYLTSYPGSSSNNFHIQWFLQQLQRRFILDETDDCGFSLDSGDNLGLGFHVPGEELHLQPYRARLRPGGRTARKQTP